MSTTKVFVAYVDGYVGRGVAEQFLFRPSQYSLYGCTWEAESVETLNRDYSRQMFDAMALPSQDKDEEENERSMPLGGSRSTLLPNAGSQEGVGNSNFFHRRDIAAVRNALLLCDWIIVELRQSQDVFEMLNFIQKSSFVRNKKFVLLSSFMTWYATPSLKGDKSARAREEENGDGDNDSVTSDLGESVTAPYPPPPYDEELKRMEAELDANDDHEDDENDEEAEILTEEQFNRRVPHVQYFNWRDTEKAVAAAHKANGLPLDTYVVFAGLPYGLGEGPLEPFFRLSWSSNAGDVIPLFKPGTQHVPTIHLTDLSNLVRKLLRCPTGELPNPSLRYVFATDGSNLSWASIVKSINKGFRNLRSPVSVEKEEYALHNNSELFTINVKVSNETAEALISREDDDVPLLMTTEQLLKKQENPWVCPGGFAENVMRVCKEFIIKHHVTPLRMAVLGPPKSGKSFLANKLSTHYKLPLLSVEDIVRDYENEIECTKRKLNQLQTRLLEQEITRRLAIKHKRILRKKREHLYGEREEEDDEETVEQDLDEECEENELSLTEEETKDAEEAMNEIFENSPLVTQWRQQVAEMERVMLLREFVPSNDVDNNNPKKKTTQAKKKSLKDSQKKKDEELQQIKELAKNAPFQNKAIALMLRWRLAQADCFNQGFVLDNVPKTVQLARMCFSVNDISPPSTEEEALQQFLRPELEKNSNGNEMEKENGASLEQCEENLLVDYVFVLEAEENVLLDRLRVDQQCQTVEELEVFDREMTIYKKEFIEPTYSLINYFECAVSHSSGSRVLLGGRKVDISVIPVDSTEGLSLPPPPQSAYEKPTLLGVEAVVLDHVGRAHHFGKTPLELHQEEVRANMLIKEKKEKEARESQLVQEQENRAFDVESELRCQNTEKLNDLKKTDLAELQSREAPLREYLMKSVVPLLSKGLVEVCKSRPEDPVEELAKWLLRNNPHDDVFMEL